MRRCMPAVAEGAIASRGGGSALAAAMTLLKGTEMRTLVGLLAGRRLDGVTMTQPTRFRVGDGLSLHNDAQDSRVVAFAWHLGWEPGDGGELAFLCPEEEEGPVKGEEELVLAVTPQTPDLAKTSRTENMFQI